MMPRQVFKTCIKTGTSELWAKVDVPVDPRATRCEQVIYPSEGRHADLRCSSSPRRTCKLDGKNPMLLYGYGGFDVCLTAPFTSFIYPWLEAGGVYAVPNLRGGGEYGKAWHDAGKGAKKQNVFDDFIAAAEYLVDEQVHQPERLAIRGGSNGGLLVGRGHDAAARALPRGRSARCRSSTWCATTSSARGKTWMPEYGIPRRPSELPVLARLLAVPPREGRARRTRRC